MGKNKLLWRKYQLAAVIILFLITASWVFILLTQERKPDPASEKIIRKAAAGQLNKDPNELTDEDFAKITQLNIDPILLIDVLIIENSEIKSVYLSNVNLLEKFVNLQELEFTYVLYPQERIPKWMKFLARYGVIDLSDRFYIDLKPLENLTNLTKIGFYSSNIKNIEPLAKLSKLETLSLMATQVCELEPLKELKNLKKLNISSCPNITDEQIEDLQKASPNLEIKR